MALISVSSSATRNEIGDREPYAPADLVGWRVCRFRTMLRATTPPTQMDRRELQRSLHATYRRTTGGIPPVPGTATTTQRRNVGSRRDTMRRESPEHGIDIQRCCHLEHRLEPLTSHDGLVKFGLQRAQFGRICGVSFTLARPRVPCRTTRLTRHTYALRRLRPKEKCDRPRV